MKKSIYLSLIFSCLSLLAYTQDTINRLNLILPKDTSVLTFDSTFNDWVYRDAEVAPEFPGGENNMYEFLGANTRYPAAAMKNSIQGRVVLRFIVTKKGKIEQITVVSKDSHPILNEEIIGVVKQMPNWTPAKIKNKPVNYYFVLPFLFNLE